MGFTPPPLFSGLTTINEIKPRIHIYIFRNVHEICFFFLIHYSSNSTDKLSLLFLWSLSNSKCVGFHSVSFTFLKANKLKLNITNIFKVLYRCFVRLKVSLHNTLFTTPKIVFSKISGSKKYVFKLTDFLSNKAELKKRNKLFFCYRDFYRILLRIK